MSFRRLPIILFFAIIIVVAISIPTKSQFVDQDSNNETLYVSGRNVNMVAGISLSDENNFLRYGDPYLQRQNEPSLAVSTVNPLHLLAGANDYRTVDFAITEGELPGLPEQAAAADGDAWLGVFKSNNGGQSWRSELLPGHNYNTGINIPEPRDSLRAFEAATDPTVRAGINGYFYYSGIAFDRIKNGRSVIFVARYKDYNDGSSNPIRYEHTVIIDEGTSGQFADKPWLAVTPEGHVYVVYSMFVGDLEKNVHNKIMFARSTDNGDSWEFPIKLSESQHINQGTTIAVDPRPNSNDVYVAWRRFADGKDPHAILIAQSTDSGRRFSKAIEIAAIADPFDQPTHDVTTGTYQFRTNAFPSIAVNGLGVVYVAWAERIFVDGPSRIKVISNDKIHSNWSEAIFQDFDTVYAEGHQFMPSLAFAAGKLMLVWYDSRKSIRLEKRSGIEGKWISDDYDPALDGEDCLDDPDSLTAPCYWRHTIDVRMAEGTPGNPPTFTKSKPVSRYIWGIYNDKLRQWQYNSPNYLLFGGGTIPFIGDYIDIAPAPMLIKHGGDWRFNTLSTDPSDFYVSWTDNRDVHPPQDGNWASYNRPGIACSPKKTGMRNQNIYASKLSLGIEAGSLGYYQVKNQNGQHMHNAFVIFINNKNDSDEIFNLILPNSSNVSFLPDDDSINEIDVGVRAHSSVYRQVFVNPSFTSPFEVEVRNGQGGLVDVISLNPNEIASSGAKGLLMSTDPFFNWDDSSLGTMKPENKIVNPNIVNPNIVNPNIVNPNIVNPNIVNPNIVNPNIVNPNIVNPNIVNPNIVNPNIVNPNIVNPNIVNTSIGGSDLEGSEIVDKVWTVVNTGDVPASYTVKTIAGSSLSENVGIYQLLVYKVFRTPGTNRITCELQDSRQEELILNITNPNLNPDTSNINIGDIFDADLNLTQSFLLNATFSLAPGDEAVVVLRVIDPRGPQYLSREETMAIAANENDPTTQAEKVANDLGALVISHESSGPAQGVAGSLQILPDDLPEGEATVPYDQENAKIRAIGGTTHYSWDVQGLPTGLDVKRDENGAPNPIREANYEICPIVGTPTEVGTFLVTVTVTDSYPNDPKTVTRQFSITIIAPPLKITPRLLPNGQEQVPYPDGSGSIVKFQATGGIPFTVGDGDYKWSWAPNPSPSGLSLNEWTGEISGQPIAGNYTIISVTVTDSIGQTDTLFNLLLCVVLPADLDISCPQGSLSDDPCKLIDGYLDEPLGEIIVSAINATVNPTATLEWSLVDAPDWLSLSGELGYSVNITGKPAYEQGKNYPETYTFQVELKEFSPATCGPVDLTATKKYEIEIYPKRPLEENLGVNLTTAKPVAMAYDDNGNIFVTGYTTGSNSDYYTVKYDADLKFQWARTYDGGGIDVPTAIAVDNGNSRVYVTGYSHQVDTGYDYCTIKYNKRDGDNRVVERYDGPSHGDDKPYAIAIDNDESSRSVYVTGSSHGGVTGPDIYTIKYARNLSVIENEARYDGPSNLGDGANAMAIGRSGNVYIAGYVHRGQTQRHADYITIKYDDSLNERWAETYDSRRNGNDIATAVAVYGSAVYVTGMSEESSKPNQEKPHDFFTVKYDSSGKLLQDVREECLGTGEDEPIAIVANPSGVYVTGFSKEGASVAAPADYYTVKYDLDLSRRPNWEKNFDGWASGDDVAAALAVESSISYVTGKSINPDGKYDYVTLKYDAGGNISWLARYPVKRENGLGNYSAVALVVNENGVYVTGVYVTGVGSGKFVTLKYTK